MTSQTPLNAVIEHFRKLSPHDRDFAIDLMHRQTIEDRRKALGVRAAQAVRNYKHGKVRHGTVSDLKRALAHD